MLHVRIKRNGDKIRKPAEQLLEVVTPRTNLALISPGNHPGMSASSEGALGSTT